MVPNARAKVLLDSPAAEVVIFTGPDVATFWLSQGVLFTT